MHCTSKDCISWVGFDFKSVSHGVKREIGGWLFPTTSHSVTEGQRVLCLLNLSHAYDMQAGNLVGKQRISLFTNFPLYVNEVKLVDKLNFHEEI